MLPRFVCGRMHLQTDYFVTSDNTRIRYGIHMNNDAAGKTVVVLNGRSEFMEKYDEPVGRLIERGFDVFSFDWRGQGLSDRLLPCRHKGYIASFDQYISDLEEIMAAVFLPRARSSVVALAHSMGGHIALRFARAYPDMLDLLVLTAPMIDIDTRPMPRWLARLLLMFGRETAYVPGGGAYVPEEQKFEGNRLTSDPRRFQDHVKAVAANPDLAVGGVTFGWLRAAEASIRILNAPGYAEKIRQPVLLVCAAQDRIVSVRAQRHFCRELPACRFCRLPGARHEILKESDDVQSRFWTFFDEFTSGLQSFGRIRRH